MDGSIHCLSHSLSCLNFIHYNVKNSKTDKTFDSSGHLLMQYIRIISDYSYCFFIQNSVWIFYTLMIILTTNCCISSRNTYYFFLVASSPCRRWDKKILSTLIKNSDLKSSFNSPCFNVLLLNVFMRGGAILLVWLHFKWWWITFFVDKLNKY